MRLRETGDYGGITRLTSAQADEAIGAAETILKKVAGPARLFSKLFDAVRYCPHGVTLGLANNDSEPPFRNCQSTYFESATFCRSRLHTFFR